MLIPISVSAGGAALLLIAVIVILFKCRPHRKRTIEKEAKPKDDNQNFVTENFVKIISNNTGAQSNHPGQEQIYAKQNCDKLNNNNTANLKR